MTLPFRPGYARLLACLCLLLPAGMQAQEGCVLGPGSERLQTEPDPRGGSITRLTSPYFVCEGDVRIRADSAVAYSFDRMSILFGSVRYEDPQRELRADHARYFSDVGRLQADGNVSVTNHQDGSTVENGDLVYLRQTEYRDVEEMTFTTGPDGVRPRATVYPRRAPPPDTAAVPPDSLGPPTDPADTTAVSVADSVPAQSPDGAATIEPPAPDAVAPSPVDSVEAEPLPEPQEYIVVGDSLFFRGDSYFTASGTVEIERDSLFAFADEAEYDGDRGELVLEGSARVESSTYDLVGRTIALLSAADGSDEVRARRDAVLTGEDLRVTAPQIVLHLADGELERMVAVPLASGPDSIAAPPGPAAPDSAAADSVGVPPQPFAVAEDFELTADSLDLAAPGGSVQHIFAAGDARSVSSGRPELNVESLPELARQDWMDADTIEVFFVPVAPDRADAVADPGESDDEYEVERIVARVGARSLYRLIPSDSTAVPGVDPPAVSYLVADQITIFMVEGQADRVESVGQVSGWHLEPVRRAAPEEPEDADGDDSGDDPDPDPDAPSSPPPDIASNDGGDGSRQEPYLSRGR